MITKNSAKVNAIYRERLRLEMRSSYGELTQRTTKGTFRRSTRTTNRAGTGTGEARWA